MARFHVLYGFVAEGERISGPIFEVNGNHIFALTDGVPKTVVAAIHWATENGLPPPVWVEFEKPRRIDEVIWEGDVVAHARSKALVLLKGTTRPIGLLVTFWHEEKDGREILHSRGWDVDKL